jgi:chromosome partitioning protein
MTARDEVKLLMEALKLPMDGRGKRRAAARAEWATSAYKPLDTHGFLADSAACATHCIAARRGPPYGEAL